MYDGIYTHLFVLSFVFIPAFLVWVVGSLPNIKEWLRLHRSAARYEFFAYVRPLPLSPQTQERIRTSITDARGWRVYRAIHTAHTLIHQELTITPPLSSVSLILTLARRLTSIAEQVKTFFIKPAPPEPQAEAPLSPEPEPQAEVPPEPPKPPPDGVFLGVSSEDTTPLFLSATTRERHLYIIGKSGTGKTTLIKNIILQDISRYHGACFIDPHGDAAEELLTTIPPDRIDDVVYLDPTKPYAPAFNPLGLPTAPQKLTEDTVAVFKMLYGSSWGYKMEHFLRNALYTLITDTEPHTLHDLRKIFTAPSYRDTITGRIADPQTQEFWRHDFDGDRQSVGAILNKLSAFLAAGSPLSHLFDNPVNHLPLKTLMDTQKVLIVNLAKGKLGEEPSRLLGALIVAGIQQAALERADIPERARVPFYLAVDEFQNYTIDTFHSILAEARKYKLFLTLANQTLGQLPTALQRAIFGNVATLISFQVSADDAGALKKEMHRSNIIYREERSDHYYPIQSKIEKEILGAQQMIRDYENEIWYLQNMKKAFDWKAVRKECYKDARKDGWPWYEWRARAEGGAKSRYSHIDYDIEENKKWIKGFEQKLVELPKVLQLPLARIKELYPFFAEIKQNTYPDTDDFINLRPHHAFSRMERAENVTAFTTDPPPPPTAGTRGKILHLMRERATEQKPKQPNQKQATPQAHPSPHQPSPEPPHRTLPPDGVNISTTPPKRRPPKPKKPNIDF